MAEGAFDVIAEIAELQFPDIEDDRSRFDLRQVEDVVDQGEEVVAGGVNRLGEFQLLGMQIPFAILPQLIGKDQQAVEGSSEFVRHVREELGLVLGGEGQLGRFFFERLAGLFHFLVLAFHFDVLLGEQAGLFFQLLVRALQFLLLALQLFGERLRLLEQVFRPHVGFDRVEHDADRFRQLVEERVVRKAETLERCQFDDGLHLAFEDDGQDDDVERR